MDKSLMWIHGALNRGSEFIWAAALACAGVYFFSGYFTTVQFDRERIDVHVEKGCVHVEGLYHYTNDSRLPAVLTLRIPFPVDHEHLQPEWYALYEADKSGRVGAEISPLVRGGDVSIRLIFRPREAKWIKLEYNQPVLARNGRYLLTTTRPWRRPIRRADFALHLPEDFHLAISNYPLSRTSDHGASKSYGFSQTEFFPTRDWVFAWDEAGIETAMDRGGPP